MYRKIVVAFTTVFTLLLLSYSLSTAKGPPDKVTIIGPGLEGEVEVNDPEMLQAFSFFQFEDIYNEVEAPKDPGEGYVVTRYIQDRDKLTPWDRAIYYPRQEGELGLVFLEGLIRPSWSEYDGRWYRASPEGNNTMRQILAEHLPPPLAKTAPRIALLPLSPSGVLAFGLLAFLILLVAFLGAQRIRASKHFSK